MIQKLKTYDDPILDRQIAEIVSQVNQAKIAAPATTGTMTVRPGGSRIITITPTGNCTFNATGGEVGQACTFSITTSGTTSYTLTFGTNFRKTGTLATGTTSGMFFTISFLCIDGTVWAETARTAVMT